MKRRLFIGKAGAGLLIPFLPVSLIAAGVAKKRQSPRVLSAELVTVINQGLIGSPQYLTITHVYSPEQTSLQTLQHLLSQDAELVAQLTQETLELSIPCQFIDAHPATFGSHSLRVEKGDLSLVWQCLARIGNPSGSVASTLKLIGNEGMLDMRLADMTYRVIDLQGRIVQANRLPAIV